MAVMTCLERTNESRIDQLGVNQFARFYVRLDLGSLWAMNYDNEYVRGGNGNSARTYPKGLNVNAFDEPNALSIVS